MPSEYSYSILYFSYTSVVPLRVPHKALQDTAITNYYSILYYSYASVVPIGVPHKALKDTSIGNHHIPKGTPVWTNLWGLHHDEDIWGDPFEFRPERFLVTEHGNEENPTKRSTVETINSEKQEGKKGMKFQNKEASENETRQDRQGRKDGSKYQLVPLDHPLRKALMPFSAGPRVCTGEMFATTRMFMILVMIMQRLDILPEKDENAQSSCDPREMKLGGVLYPPDFKVRFVEKS